MWVGNLMLLALNLPLIGIWIRMLTMPYRLLFPSYTRLRPPSAHSSLNNNSFDVTVTRGPFGVVGYFSISSVANLHRLILGFILGPIMEEHLRRAMRLSRGDPTVFFLHPACVHLRRR